MYLAPTYIPDGMKPLRITGGNEPAVSRSVGGSAEIDRSQLWVRFDAAGDRPVEDFTVQWGPGSTATLNFPGRPPMPHTDDPLQGYRVQSTPETVRGHPGLYSTEQHTLAWEEPPGKMVAVRGVSLSLGELHGIAEGLQPRTDGGFTVTQVPEGFVQVAESAGWASDGANERDVIYRDAANHAFRVHIVDGADRPPGTNLEVEAGLNGDPRLVEVRGHHAVLAKQLLSGSGGYDQQTLFLQGADEFVQWLEPANVMVTVSTIGLSEDDTLAIARGLQIVDADGWDLLVVQAPGRTGVPPVPPSAEPPTFQGDEAAVADAYLAWLNNRDSIDAAVATLEDGESLRDTIAASRATATAPLDSYWGRVDAVRLVGSDHALVTYSILSGGSTVLGNQQGAAVRVNGRWLVSRATYCAIVEMVGIQCPPP